MTAEHLEIAGFANVPVYVVPNLIIGSGAAGLNCAEHLHELGQDFAVVTDCLGAGTSANSGSDKQTYYKMGVFGDVPDSPMEFARSLFNGGMCHGDLAYVEALGSLPEFFHLVRNGVEFPCNRYGAYVGYKTDHDPRQRATSIGPWTSREMCRALTTQVRQRGIRVRERANVTALLTPGEGAGRRCVGALALLDGTTWHAYLAENVVYATGGPGGLYRTSVYPEGHTGAIGVALLAGARARNLSESQFGLASTAFRWNVSGSYMQAIPRIVSTAPDGATADADDAREFLRPCYASVAELAEQVFLKGYQWPFDTHKIVGGSSLIDLLVYQETVLRGRRVYLDYRRNPDGLSLSDLGVEARAYLERSGAMQETPFERLQALNPAAVALYRAHGIDLAAAPLEVAVCAQHNNGGLAADHAWESENLTHLFPVGEVNGSHGVYRPGGAALNAGQVGGYRLAESIAARYASRTLDRTKAVAALTQTTAAMLDWGARSQQTERSWQTERAELQARMTRACAHVRSGQLLAHALDEARAQWQRVDTRGCRHTTDTLGDALTTRQLCFAHLVYLEAAAYAVAGGVGSRGSALVLAPAGSGTPIHPALGDAFVLQPEDERFRAQVLETEAAADGSITSRWAPRRPVPPTDAWFETTWAAWRADKPPGGDGKDS